VIIGDRPAQSRRASAPQVAYGLLALVGLVATWVYNFQYIAANGPNLLGFFALGFVNPAAASLTLDVVIAAGAALIFFVVEGRRTGMRHVWVYCLLATFVGLSVALGLFLLMRERLPTRS
jgi:hypothetical protein